MKPRTSVVLSAVQTPKTAPRTPSMPQTKGRYKWWSSKTRWMNKWMYGITGQLPRVSRQMMEKPLLISECPWCPAWQDWVEKVGRDDGYFPSLVWRVNSISTGLWRTVWLQQFWRCPSELCGNCVKPTVRTRRKAARGPAGPGTCAPCSPRPRLLPTSRLSCGP